MRTSNAVQFLRKSIASSGTLLPQCSALVVVDRVDSGSLSVQNQLKRSSKTRTSEQYGWMDRWMDAPYNKLPCTADAKPQIRHHRRFVFLFSPSWLCSSHLSVLDAYENCMRRFDPPLFIIIHLSFLIWLIRNRNGFVWIRGKRER